MMVALSFIAGLLIAAAAVTVIFYIGYRKGRYDEQMDMRFADTMRRRYGS